MTNIDGSRLLEQMRTMAAAAGGAPAAAGHGDDEGRFADLLEHAINKVNEQQKTAGELKRAFELGDQSVNLAQVMVEAQKSSVSFQAMVEVRNKIISAYQEIMNMQI